MEIAMQTAPADLDAIIRKSSRRLLWILILLYFMNVLDRGTASYAALTMNPAIGLSTYAYGLGASLFFAGIFLAEIPSNLMLQRVGARLWLARIAVTWGLVAMLFALVQGPISYGFLRFLLGLAEAGALPGIMLYFTYWFPEESRGRYLGLFLVSLPIANVVAGPMASSILSLDGWLGLAGWQWLFIIEGAPAICVGILAYFLLPDRPHKARWLSREEADVLVEAIEREQPSGKGETHRPVWRALFDLRIIALGVTYACIQVAGITSNAFVPMIVRQYVATDFAVGWLLPLPYAVSAFFMVLWGRWSDKLASRHKSSGRRIFAAVLPLVLCGIGWVGTGFATSTQMVVGALTLALVGYYGALTIFWTLPPLFLDRRARAAGIAWVAVIGSVSAIIAPWAIGALREATGDFRMGLFMVGGICLSAILALLLLSVLHRRATSAGDAPAERLAQP